MNLRRITATVAFAAFFAGSAASVAQALPIDPVNGPGKGCPIVNTDSNGNETVTYAKPGDRNGMLVCGSDGEWSFSRKAGTYNGQMQVPNQGVSQR
ncbi:hypothetical protein QMK17_17470 [Rhodococcus sp. G-MC3]|uniref:hypothetical protein n=1 Tax=Rhodococcus sp. G-MC3 TaxID=3046209 RepID=UPI0024B8B58E|nr:hypothetical protein [Rhodococcus sp. G-MC3]MDJ0395117.1 hypothetical protein [Rhodococcus sp. G-MC3]